MARGAEMQRLMSIAFARRRVHKRYVAVVAGRLETPEGDWGLIDLPMRVDWPNRPRSKVDAEFGKPSLTRWRVLDHGDDCTRVELEPVTGRSHQLRVHLAALGHPVLGDPLYASPAIQARSARMLLHAAALAFLHPQTQAALAFESRVPF
jgi:tRNA pseudouridine32 synthase/23S rRNA pseudouridine746 synthase